MHGRLAKLVEVSIFLVEVVARTTQRLVQAVTGVGAFRDVLEGR